MKPEEFIHMPIPANMFTAVCALLGAGAAVAAPKPQAAPASATVDAKPATAPASEPSANTGSSEPVGSGSTAPTAASPSDGEVDAGGHPWSADLHASTKGKTKDGYWRMKVGVSRPDPLPGFPTGAAPDTGTSTGTEAASATSQAATAPVVGQPATADEDDEFAAFREAAASSDAKDATAAASVPARKFSDADLGSLCNQAAVKLGDPTPVKELIAKFVPEGTVAHSRNIPEDKREEFAAAVEEKAGIEFAG